MMLGGRVAVFEGKRPKVLVDAVAEVKVAGPAGEPHALEDELVLVAKPVVQGGPPKRRGRGKQGKPTV